jgi:predicted TIM-barrel fold metal-dependent hydrolase
VAQAHGVGHLVLVQPSVYGTNNEVMLRALAVKPGHHRGVAVVADDVTDAELEAMHALGVRGVRFNLVSPVGESAPPSQRLSSLAPRLRRLGWHVQWYANAHQLPAIATLHAHSGVRCVLDHLGGFSAHVAHDELVWHAAESLAAQGAWLKLSGWYRLGDQAPYHALLSNIRRLAHAFGERMVWGSDWPHTMFAPHAMPTYESTWQPVVDALGSSAATALRQACPAIYQ